MDLLTTFAIICFTAIIHASFQLSVSTMTLMSGHALGRRTSFLRLQSLTSFFVIGVTVMTILLLSTGCWLYLTIFRFAVPSLVWIGLCGLSVGVGISVSLFYYRGARGTVLWLPRSIAEYLTARSKRTKNPGEAFGLGCISVLAELIFLFAPLSIASLTVLSLPASLQLAGMALYVVVSLVSLLAVMVLIGSGHKISSIQYWRERNKHFLQYAAGAALIILGFFIYVYAVLDLPPNLGMPS
jgi:hypothetical protein